MMYRSAVRLLPLIAVAFMLAGCETLRYYGHALSGQLDVLSRRQPIATMLRDPALGAELKHKLMLTQQLRAFASSELGLPDSGSFTSYVDLDRPFVIWNVFAAPELSLEQRQWCYPLFGCFSYRGFFDRSLAHAYAARLEAGGEDIYVGGVRAYSTLGWFDDPVYRALLDDSEPRLAGLIFHELAHERLYVRDDTAFNESFATTVQLEGVQRWLQAQGRGEEYGSYLQARRRDDAVVDLLLSYRERLAALYASAATSAIKRSAKQRLFAVLREDYDRLRSAWGGEGRYDAFVAERLNNASLAAIGTYHRHVPAFQALLTQHRSDLSAFYAAAESLAALSSEARADAMDNLAYAAGVGR